jgi:hypothetical protein
LSEKEKELSERKKQELSIFLNEDEEIEYNKRCIDCTRQCKQSYKVHLDYCPYKDSTKKKNKK